MKIVLSGYMGSGKSTIGRLLAKKKNIPFIDLDTYIEDKEGLAIKEIFSAKGEVYFRLQETVYLNQILESNQDYVLSLGGGTPCYGNNMKMINNADVISIYLKASINTLANRLQTGKKNRPLIASLNKKELKEYIGKHLFERTHFYEQSEKIVSIDDKNKEKIIAQIEFIVGGF